MRAFDQLLLVRPRFEVREERTLPHGRVFRLDDWIYEGDQYVVNSCIFLHQDARKSGDACDSAAISSSARWPG